MKALFSTNRVAEDACSVVSSWACNLRRICTNSEASVIAVTTFLIVSRLAGNPKGLQVVTKKPSYRKNTCLKVEN